MFTAVEQVSFLSVLLTGEFAKRSGLIKFSSSLPKIVPVLLETSVLKCNKIYKKVCCHPLVRLSVRSTAGPHFLFSFCFTLVGYFFFLHLLTGLFFSFTDRATERKEH